MASRILRLSISSPRSFHPLRSNHTPTLCTSPLLPYSFLPPSSHRLTLSTARRTLTSTRPRLGEGDLGNPQSSSNDQAKIKQSRATEGAHSPDTASLAQPVSNRSAIPGNQDEGTPTEDAVKRSPEEPAEEKRKSVEKQGEKPLGVEDEQK